jgi:hypothetical protein
VDVRHGFGIDLSPKSVHSYVMSFAELKEKVAEMTDEQRLELAAVLAFHRRRNDPEHLAELDRRMKAMDNGKKVPQEEIERKHRELLAQGR